jgi:hypothetical protein
MSSFFISAVTRKVRLGIGGIVDVSQAHFVAIRVYFALGVSENTTKYVDIVRMISSIHSLSVKMFTHFRVCDTLDELEDAIFITYLD